MMRNFLWAAPWIAAFVFLMVSVLDFWSARAGAVDAVSNLADCRTIAKQIETLRSTPQLASRGESASRELTRRVERAMSSAGIDSSELIRIDPQESRRVGDTAYLEQSTFVEIRRAPLAALITFLKEATVDAAQLKVTSIRLTAPRSKPPESQEFWKAEVTLTNLVFSPQSRRPRNPQSGTT